MQQQGDPSIPKHSLLARSQSIEVEHKQELTVNSSPPNRKLRKTHQPFFSKRPDLGRICHQGTPLGQDGSTGAKNMSFSTESKDIIWRWVKHHANHPTTGSGKIGSYRCLQPAKNSAIATGVEGGGGLASTCKLYPRLRQGFPPLHETEPMVGGSLAAK